MIKLQRKIIFAGIAGIILSFCYVAGYYLDCFDSLDLLEGSFYGIWLAGAIPASLIVFGIFKLAEYVNKRVAAGSSVSRKLPYIFCAVFLLLCWLPAWCSLFPGAFNYDAYTEWQQVAQGNITAHHPVVHVLLLGGLVEGFYALTGSYNVGIAVYTGLQLVLLALLLAAVVKYMRKFGLPLILQAFALLFFGLSPVVQLFAISATKDTLFSAVELLFFLYVLRFFHERETFFTRKRTLVGFVFTSFFTMILRNNGLYIVLFSLLILAFFCIRDRRKFGRQSLVVLLGIGLLYGMYVGPVYSALGVRAGGVEEMLSVPLQQMARVHKYDYASLEQEDLEVLYAVVPKENLDKYRATVSDFVKADFQREAFDLRKGEFFKLWLKWGLEHPLTYINSFLVNTVDCWYPQAVVDGYRHADGRGSFFDYQVDVPGTEVVLLPGLHDFYEKLSHDVELQKKPLAFLVLSPGWYVIVAVVVFLYVWCYRRYKLIVPMLILLLSFLTVLLGPMALVRYVLIFYFAFPVLLSFLLAGDCYGRQEKAAVKKAE